MGPEGCYNAPLSGRTGRECDARRLHRARASRPYLEKLWCGCSKDERVGWGGRVLGGGAQSRGPFCVARFVEAFMRPTSDPLPESVSAALGLDSALGAGTSAGGEAGDSSSADPKRKSRRWESRLVKQKTLSGEVLVRKWVSDEPPTFSEARLTSGDSQPQFCPLEGCGKAFSDAVSLRKHMYTHDEKQYVCQVEGCGKRFLDSSKLKRHSLTHTGERPYLCPFEGCGKRFSLDFNLRSHMRTHTGERPYICSYPGCDKRFAQEYNLKTHMKSHFTDEGSSSSAAGGGEASTSTPPSAPPSFQSAIQAAAAAALASESDLPDATS